VDQVSPLRGRAQCIAAWGRRKIKRTRKKKKDPKKKKDKKHKNKEAKKSKKQESTSTCNSGSSSAGSSSATNKVEAKKRKKEDGEAAISGELLPAPQEAPKLDNLTPPEDGIQRFIFEVSEKGPLGLRFSGGFPPLILAVLPDTFAAKKNVPPNFEVHAINGHALVPQNHEVVMSGLKMRPVALDVRPQGWKPREKVKELERKREREEAERQARVLKEEMRREQVAQETAERLEREAAEKAVREAQERSEREELERRAREARAKQKAKEEEFEKALAADPPELRKAANELMEANYGSEVRLQSRRGLPLRLLTRRKEVAWLWAGEAQELIGGGVQDDPADSWS